MSNPRYAISVQEVHKTFHEMPALRSINMSFAAGQMHGVIGPEGAGKTTLMRMILGLLKPNEGQIVFLKNEKPIAFEEIRSSIAYMPQQQSLYPELSIDEHLEFFKDLYGISKEMFSKRRHDLLHMTRLSQFVDRPAGNLSGGMYKKLGLMCALLRSPLIMLLDEPTNGVDPISRREFWELLYYLSDQNILILVTTAYMDEAERCGRIHLLEKGQVIAEGEPRELLREENVGSFDELFLRREHGV